MKQFALLLVAAVCAHAQAVRFQSQATTTNTTCTIGQQCPLYVVPGTTVQFLNSSGTGLATTYTDWSAANPCPGTAQVTPLQGGVCVSSVDSQGNFGAWLMPGNYYYSITFPSGDVFGPFPVSLIGGSSSSVPFFISTTLTSAQLLALVNGVPLTAQVTAGNGGAGYAPGDIGQILAGNNEAIYTVLTVGAGGSVVTFSLSQHTPGANGYAVSSGNATNPATGGGDGNLEIDILTVRSATPFAVVPAVTGKTIIPASISMVFNAVTTPYAVAQTLGLDYANSLSTNAFGTVASALLQKTSQTEISVPLPSAAYTSSPAGQALMLHGNNVSIYGGDGTLTVIVVYTVI